MSKRTGGPAFPVPDSEYQIQDTGMTLRDYFAAKAMQAVLVNGYFDKFESVASDAYKLADAMLRSREVL
ncbi:TPA: hypothetical protein N2N62_000726 [Citrobacter freundii]|nr:hypothetical protein [Citrobacter freundii]WIJ96158.1 hypothetical protein OI904_09225 [Citrobacter freundii]HCL5679148.1 hypothetical protein [Citrobacter freundii]HCL6562020.1 hypothetical protein [Citrobacter freundii]HED3635838.1 hypothetical protein [Citrobacter freundii]